MNNEFSFEITNESKNAINEILKQQGARHFKLYTDFYGELDVINYEEYQKLKKEKDKEIERLNNIINNLDNYLLDIGVPRDFLKELKEGKQIKEESKSEIITDPHGDTVFIDYE